MTSSGWTSFAAFKVPSASMCPTICSGERIVADLGAYRSKSPERGALVLLQHRFSPALCIKRVVGLPGDIVGPGLSTGKRSYFPRCVAPLFSKSTIPPTIRCSIPEKSPRARSLWWEIASAIVSTAESPDLGQLSWVTCAENQSSCTGRSPVLA
jgi:Signal peptidase, peptidase S26